ncbi:hypothetical protein MMC24_005503 [Lignoscripta atroalba]|nr:hypothetical protein [Lignoscripta atroalba]
MILDIGHHTVLAEVLIEGIRSYCLLGPRQTPIQYRQGSKSASCKHFYACVDEALRMFSLWAMLHGVKRIQVTLVVDNENIPVGYDVGSGVYAIHHNAQYYPEPFKYPPEWWLVGGHVSEDVAEARRAFAPFNLGNRACDGKSLAYKE